MYERGKEGGKSTSFFSPWLDFVFLRVCALFVYLSNDQLAHIIIIKMFICLFLITIAISRSEQTRRAAPLRPTNRRDGISSNAILIVSATHHATF